MYQGVISPDSILQHLTLSSGCTYEIMFSPSHYPRRVFPFIFGVFPLFSSAPYFPRPLPYFHYAFATEMKPGVGGWGSSWQKCPTHLNNIQRLYETKTQFPFVRPTSVTDRCYPARKRPRNIPQYVPGKKKKKTPKQQGRKPTFPSLRYNQNILHCHNQYRVSQLTPFGRFCFDAPSAYIKFNPSTK